jgi:hypothetical protein
MSENNTDMIQTERETLLHALIERLRHRGYDDLRVSRLEEFEGKRPAIIFWEDTDIRFMPDASAVKGMVPFIFQVETHETLQSDDAQQRIALFSAYARHYQRHYCLVVPAEDMKKAKVMVLNQGIDERFVHVVSA